MNYHAECWFPCMCHIMESEPDEKIKSHCLKLREEFPESQIISNVKGWQSGSFETQTDTGTIKSPHYTERNFEPIITSKLYKLFDETINTVINGQVRIFNYWININGKGAYNLQHNHPQSHLSGVYYVSCPKDSGVITFENPWNFMGFDELSSYTDEFRINNAQHKSIYIEPKDGLLIVFPSHLRHAVPENKSDEERISIAFNLIVIPNQQSQFY